MKVSVNKNYKPISNDCVLLLYVDEKTPLFSSDFITSKPPAEAGVHQLHSIGELAGVKNVCIKTCKLDITTNSINTQIKIIVKQAIDNLQHTSSKRLVVLLGDSPQEMVKAAQEGAILGSYTFDKYKKDTVKKKPSMLIQTTAATTVKKSLLLGEQLFRWVNFARDILNEPASVIHPESLAKIFTTSGRKAGMKVSVWKEPRLIKENCTGVLAVGGGAKSRPCMVIGEYTPAKYKKHLVLVGKGVTFDTGGYCLKPGSSQIGMKLDMGGAAMMFAAACAISEAKLPIKLTVLTPLAENDISSTAYHTEDILQMRNGISVEVGNTDAEGRLILADALDIASQMKPDYIVDSATLTGACMVGLGEDIAGLFSNDSILSGEILDAAEDAGEYMWELPLHLPYAKQLESTVADTSNIGGKYGGSLTAALFLRKFVGDGIDWAHIDIAGPGIKHEAHEHLGKGAKGFGVKSIYNLATSLS